MKLDELSPQLRSPFKDKVKGGVLKINSEEYKNVYFVVPPNPPYKIEEKLPFNLIAEANSALSSLPKFEEMTEVDKLINYLFVRREVVQSSRIEGTWSTIDHALSSEPTKANGKDVHEAVRNYAHVIDEFVEIAHKSKESVFNEEIICRIHKGIIERDPNSSGIPGKIRKTGQPGSVVFIGGRNRVEESIYNPAPSSEVKRCLKDFLLWLSDDEFAQKGDAGLGLSLPIRIAVAHSHFEAIHPFTDGNGRVGRALWPLQMVASGHMPLYLSGYVESAKYEYGKALESAQKKLKYAPIIEFICKAILESSIEVKKSKEAILNLENEWLQRGKFKSNSTAMRSLQLLLKYPIITSKLIQHHLKISGPASTNAINRLIESKIIRLRQFENRSPVYAAEEVIHILSRPFGGDIDLALVKARLILNFNE